ncbi:MAG: response regulator [Clostridiales bacterium]|nr:response regulator [Clostridiales bacterium]
MADYDHMSKDELVAEIERLHARLDEANAANVAKEVFLSNMSHDIRTPMNAILGMAALAQKHIDEKTRVADALGKIQTAGRHLLELINDVLDMSRINSGKLRLVSERFALGDLIHDISIIIKPQMTQKGHNWSFKAENIQAEALLGDALRLRQIYVNIISNAIKYTSAGGDIRISLSEELEGELCRLNFSCVDNGIGMSPEFLTRVFEPFERAQHSGTSGIEGTGVGMSIVKKLVEALGGEIGVASEQGKGTRVDISIPLSYEHLELDLAPLKGKRLLIIENDEETRSAYQLYLGEYDLDYSLVRSAAEALSELTLAEFENKKYDLAVIGESIQNSQNPLDIAEYLQKSRPQLPLMLVSSADWEKTEYQAQRSGIRSFVPLPIFRKSLINALSGVLKSVDGGQNASDNPDLTGKGILLVEDNFINREIAMEILASTNAAVECAENGKQALEMFAASEPKHYDIILMDIQMPVMDGYTAASSIRALDRNDAAAVPIYAMTANTFQEDIDKALAAGMNGHIAKPIDINALMQVLRRVAGA